METFEIKELLTVKGKSGLWRFVKLIPASKMVRVQNLCDENMNATVKASDVVAISSYKVFLKNGEMSLEDVINFIMELEMKGELSKEELDSYENLSDEKKVEMMSKLVPDYDDTQFKHFHLTKIIKWYKEISKALDILNAGIVDPYEKDETKTTE